MPVASDDLKPSLGDLTPGLGDPAASPDQSGHHQPPGRHPALGYLACATAGCLWSTGFYFGKIVLREMPVADMVLYRFLFAVVGFLPLLRRPRFTPGEWRILLMSSLLGVPLQFLTQFYGLSLTTVSHAALMVGTIPMLLAIGATLFAHERLGALGWGALALSSAGVALIVISSNMHAAHAGAAGRQVPGGQPSLAGDLLVIVSMVICVAYLLLNKRLLRTHSPLVVTAWGMLVGTIMLAVWVIVRTGPPPVRHVSLPAWGALAASGLLCTATTTLLWNWAMRHVPASRAAVFLNIEPALGSALGVWLLGDTLGPLTWVGGSLILTAAITLTSTGRAETEMMPE
jgi:drug/metabolite transporter (DMT)-like permease